MAKVKSILKHIKLDKFSKRAIKHFETTKDPVMAGYILRDGKMLDFSGKKWGSQGRERVMDHREINSVGIDMPEFLHRTKAIRFGMTGSDKNGRDVYLQFIHKMSPDQRKKLKEIKRKFKPESTFVDVHKKSGKLRFSKEFLK